MTDDKIATVQSKKQANDIVTELVQTSNWTVSGKNEWGVIYSKQVPGEKLGHTDTQKLYIEKKTLRQWNVVLSKKPQKNA